MSEQTEITFMQTRLIRLASDCCSIGSPAVYRYDDCTGSGKSLRHAGTGRICGNNAGGACCAAGWLANFLVSYAALRKSWPTEKVELS